jgi:hypothetical protein
MYRHPDGYDEDPSMTRWLFPVYGEECQYEVIEKNRKKCIELLFDHFAKSVSAT